MRPRPGRGCSAIHGWMDCATDHYLAFVKVRERLALSKQAAKKFDVERFNIRKLKELEVRKQF